MALMQRPATAHRHAVACPRCRGWRRFRRFIADLFGGCSGCNGYGWLWNDGVIPKPCPGGGVGVRFGIVPTTGRLATDLPCGRSGRRCPGCDRAVEDIR